MSDAVEVALIMGGFSIVPSLIGVYSAKRSATYAKKATEVSTQTTQKINDLHTLINSGLTVRLDEARQLGTLQGKQAERDKNDLQNMELKDKE